MCISQDEGDAGNNTSDEEFERQLEEASLIAEQEKESAPKKGGKRGRRGMKKKNKTRLTSKYPTDPDAEGYEVKKKYWLYCLKKSQMAYVGL